MTTNLFVKTAIFTMCNLTINNLPLTTKPLVKIQFLSP